MWLEKLYYRFFILCQHLIIKYSVNIFTLPISSTINQIMTHYEEVQMYMAHPLLSLNVTELLSLYK